MTLNEKIQLLDKLGKYLALKEDTLEVAIHQTYIHNKWLTVENCHLALEAIRTTYLDEKLLKNWVENYSIPKKDYKSRVGLILAGNIPLVGFHDILCVFLSGHKALIKLSDKDKYLIPFLLKKMIVLDSRVEGYFEIIERLEKPNAVIATGSNNSARYFQAYFGKYPHIIRQNRNGVAVLNGKEDFADLLKLGNDIFRYFGLGCRNVSKLYIPKGYNFDILLEALHEYREIVKHDKYKNNFDYNYTLVILNKIPYKSNGCIILTENKTIPSRIASLHYEVYTSKSELEKKLLEEQDQIQCVVSKEPITNINTIPLGMAQNPSIKDYADSIDTMNFLIALN